MPRRTSSKPIKISTKISKNFRWVEKYLRRAKKHMPSLILPRQIRSYRPPKTKEQRTFGTCSSEDRIITLATHRSVPVKGAKRRHRKLITFPQRELLMTLAHEMAHLRYDPHSYEQESYARIIFHAFGLLERCPTCKGTGRMPVRYVN